ncbi:hypothetical protein F2P56_007646 [Juglans regia]|uniref:Uncharacterized protein n=1 Tax=Juglans regia TaxID=51240 RepID=A0A833Y448_JUGRE|nr:hypothetical protein F2P56_007646 [Juglans regia]
MVGGPTLTPYFCKERTQPLYFCLLLCTRPNLFSLFLSLALSVISSTAVLPSAPTFFRYFFDQGLGCDLSLLLTCIEYELEKGFYSVWKFWNDALFALAGTF